MEKGSAKRESQPLVTPWRIGLLLVCLLSVLPFLTSLSGSAVWDDRYILDGVAIGGGEEFVKTWTKPFNFNYFRPMVSMSFFLDRSLFGVVPFFYHQTNILIHLATGLVIVALGLALFKDRLAAILGGLIFAVQPVQASTVGWVGGRTDSLCALFVALFLWALIKGAQSERKRWWLVGSALALFCALLCKEQALALVAVVPGALAWLDPAKPDRKTVLWRCTPFAIVSLAFVNFWLAFFVQAFEPVPLGAIQQLEWGGRGLAHYALLLLLPNPWSLHTFTFETSREFGYWPVALGYAAFLSCCWWAWQHRKSRPEIALCLAAVLVTVLPVSNVVPVPSLSVGPYRVGISGVALAVLFGAIAAGVMSRATKRPLAYAAIGIYLLACTALTGWAQHQWRSEKAIFSAMLRYDPGFVIAGLNIGVAEGASPSEIADETEGILDWIFRSEAWREPDSAGYAWRTDPAVPARIVNNQGVKADPEDIAVLLFRRLGLARRQLGDLEGAAVAFNTVTAIDGRCPYGYQGLGLLALDRQDPASALEHYRQAVARGPDLYDSQIGAAISSRELGDWERAAFHYAAAAQWKPWLGDTYTWLAEAQLESGNPRRALASLALANQGVPADAEHVEELRRRIERTLNSQATVK